MKIRQAVLPVAFCLITIRIAAAVLLLIIIGCGGSIGTLGVVCPCCRLRRSFYLAAGVSPARRRVSAQLLYRS